MIAKSKAIVLSKQDYKNTSLIVTFYTQDFGKIICLVKGAHRKGKYNSNFDLFSLNQIVFYKGKDKNLEIVSECNLIQSYQNIRRDIRKISYGIYFIELMDLATEQGNVNPEIFNLFLLTFNFLSGGMELEKISRIFEIRLLTLSGLMPRIDGCTFCGKKIYKDAWFSKKLGGLLCRNCLDKDIKAIKLLKGTVVSFDRLINNNNISFLEKLSFIKPVSNQLREVLTEFLNYHFGKKAKSGKFLKQLERLQLEVN